MKVIYLIFLAVSVQCLAASKSNDFSRNTGEVSYLSAKDLQQRLEIEGHIYVTDKQGKLLYQANESRVWKFNGGKTLESNWVYSSDQLSKPIALSHTWEIDDNGEVNISIAQYKSIKRDPQQKGDPIKTGLIKKKKFTLKNFETITWPTGQQKDKNVIIKLHPKLSDKKKISHQLDFSLSADEITITDNRGYAWATDLYASGKYVGFTTHQGALFLSYRPFPGSKEIGEAGGKQISLYLPKNLQISLTAQTHFLPPGVFSKVHGLYLPHVRTKRPNSVRISTTDKEDEFLQVLHEKR